MANIINRLKTAALCVALGSAGGLVPSGAQAAQQTAIVAGGCFWCVESDFESVPGVGDVVSGYTGGRTENPDYGQVGRGSTGHYEAVMIPFDDSIISYRQIMDLFFRSVDPTDAGGQFCDRGNQYRTAIFVTTQAQADTAVAAKAAAQNKLGRQIVTPIIQASTFYKAEAYHQNYYKGTNLVLTRGGAKRQSDAYDFYRKGCGRDARVQQLWGADAPFLHH
ncbi:peptide-methionine (S)-S-oxide reductase MsrA [Loktanella salsilacus]|uniref:peptide-methionine (S)-S-oxide reductase MsrA n=1 Tax=Loktanella salsilacus TaxID=195913 RepID=UPI003736A394